MVHADQSAGLCPGPHVAAMVYGQGRKASPHLSFVYQDGLQAVCQPVVGVEHVADAHVDLPGRLLHGAVRECRYVVLDGEEAVLMVVVVAQAASGDVP